MPNAATSQPQGFVPKSIAAGSCLISLPINSVMDHLIGGEAFRRSLAYFHETLNQRLRLRGGQKAHRTRESSAVDNGPLTKSYNFRRTGRETITTHLNDTPAHRQPRAGAAASRAFSVS
jgi:hypothetical protein